MNEFRYVNRLPLSNKIVRFLWSLVYHILFKTTPRWCLNGWRRSLLRVFGAKIGVGCRIDPTAKVWLPVNLIMGDYVAIGASVNLYSVDKIFIGTKVAISEYAYICGASHDIGYLDRPLTQSTISIHDHAWIASGAMVHPGTIVGTGTVVAARAVVKGELESWKVFAGNPAKIVKARVIKDGSIT